MLKTRANCYEILGYMITTLLYKKETQVMSPARDADVAKYILRWAAFGFVLLFWGVVLALAW